MVTDYERGETVEFLHPLFPNLGWHTAEIVWLNGYGTAAIYDRRYNCYAYEVPMANIRKVA